MAINTNRYQNKLMPVGDFSDLHYEFIQREAPETNRQVTSANGFNIILDSEVLPEQQNRVWWRWTGTFEISYPQFRTKLVTTRTGKNIYLPDPPNCSAYFIAPDSSLVGPFHDCSCCDCWVSQFNSLPGMSDATMDYHGTINDVNVAFVEANVRTFYNKYHIDVEQLSVSEAVYNFWQAVLKQERTGSSLFQTPPPRTAGNIRALRENSPAATGYFAAAAVKHHTLTINRSDIPYNLKPIDTLIMPCTQAYPYSSLKRPTFW